MISMLFATNCKMFFNLFYLSFRHFGMGRSVRFPVHMYFLDFLLSFLPRRDLRRWCDDSAVFESPLRVVDSLYCSCFCASTFSPPSTPTSSSAGIRTAESIDVLFSNLFYHFCHVRRRESVRSRTAARGLRLASRDAPRPTAIVASPFFVVFLWCVTLE